MILADGNYEIMTLLRSHRDDAKGLQIMARHVYPLHSIRLRQAVTAEQLAAALDGPDASTLRGARYPTLNPRLPNTLGSQAVSAASSQIFTARRFPRRCPTKILYELWRRDARQPGCASSRT